MAAGKLIVSGYAVQICRAIWWVGRQEVERNSCWVYGGKERTA